MKRILALAAFALASACSTSYTYYDASKPHHGESGFRNNYPHEEIAAGFWKFTWEKWRDDLPRHPPEGYHFPIDKPDVVFLRANRSEPTMTWIGHATLLLQLGGVNILTDPHLTERASPFSFLGPKRWVPPALNFAELPHIDIVVISHNHYDHLDLDTVRALNQQAGGPPKFYVPLGLQPWFTDQGIDNVVELDWWDRREQSGLTITFVPVQHWSTRARFDRNRSLWGGWVIEQPGFRLFFSGDTGYSKDFQDVAKRFDGFDLAALPIGAYEPRWFMKPQHISPAEAVQIHRDLHARRSVGIHWGTFSLSTERLDEPPRALAEARAEAGLDDGEFFVMRHGETRKLARWVRSTAFATNFRESDKPVTPATAGVQSFEHTGFRLPPE